ncbi:hypothetical protein [Burkholderia alba]|uniref:hypothetical protein n=1 Tax=Burkholderia alba TaxID=2683677 RepID=UPI002B05BAB4|nr:hypothetical protein [Burkholderia alba]
MKSNDKSRKARSELEKMFAGVQQGPTSTARRAENPFADTAPARSDDVTRTEPKSTIWKDSVVSLPVGIEVPPGYRSVEQVREAMQRAWQIKPVRQSRDAIEVELLPGWKASKLPNGTTEIRDAAGVTRAVYGWSHQAELRLLPRYAIESREGASDGKYQLIVRDRERNAILERSLFSAQNGTNHPEWRKWNAWLDEAFPLHRDPLRCWGDCEAILGG